MKSIKRIIAVILIVSALLLSVSAALASTVYATGNVNLRKGAGKGYGIITGISKGASLEKLDSKKDERGVTWYKVRTKGGKTGWVSSVFASPSGKGSKTKTTTGTVNVRNKPSLSGKVIDGIGKGRTLSYTDTAKDGRGVTWYLVTIGNTAGWISGKNLK